MDSISVDNPVRFHQTVLVGFHALQIIFDIDTIPFMLY
jgi:hypothetical protein